MKKALISFLILLLFLSSCGRSTVDPPPEESTETETTTEDEEDIPIEPPETVLYDHLRSKYLSLDDICASVTDIVEAVFVEELSSRYPYGGLPYYNFSVTNVIRGSETAATVSVRALRGSFYIAEKDILYSVNDCPYEPGKAYLLLLTRVKGTYGAEDLLLFSEESLVIQLDGPDAILNASSMYGEQLHLHIESEELLNAFQNRTYSEKLSALTEQNPLFSGNLYDDSVDMKTVVTNADYVFEISLKMAIRLETDPTFILYNDVLRGTYKGDIVQDYIWVVFYDSKPSDIIEDCIITATKVDMPNGVVIVYPGSTFPVSERDAIIQLIEAETQ